MLGWQLFSLTGSLIILECVRPNDPDLTAAEIRYVRAGHFAQINRVLGNAKYTIQAAVWVAALRAIFFWNPISWFEISITILWLAFFVVRTIGELVPHAPSPYLELWPTRIFRFLALAATVIQLESLGTSLLGGITIASVIAFIFHKGLNRVGIVPALTTTVIVLVLFKNDPTLGGNFSEPSSVSKNNRQIFRLLTGSRLLVHYLRHYGHLFCRQFYSGLGTWPSPMS
jgi:hypothetical protein